MKTVTWSKIFRTCSGMNVDNALAIIDLLNSLPPTSVKNESCFSQMKYLKNDRRGRMSQENLHNALLVRLEAPDIAAFNPDAAVERFLVS